MLSRMKDAFGWAIEGGEQLSLAHTVQSETGLTIDNVLIEGDRWGSSGYYPASVLESDGATAFPAGTQIFLDHTELGKTDSAAKLIGELEADARYVIEDDGKKVLRAPMHFYETGTHNAAWVKERVKRLGISIRSGVKVAPYVDESGRTGKRVTAFTKGISVDVVARAGAGGKFGTIKESADPLLATETERYDMTPEERAALAQETATALAAALAPSFAAVTTALEGVKTSVAESAKAAKPALTGAEVADKLSKVKIPAAAVARVWAAFEAENGDVDVAIAAEAAQWKEAVEEAAKSKGEFVNENEGESGNGTSTVVESDIPAGWGVSK